MQGGRERDEQGWPPEYSPGTVGCPSVFLYLGRGKKKHFGYGQGSIGHFALVEEEFEMLGRCPGRVPGQALVLRGEVRAQGEP